MKIERDTAIMSLCISIYYLWNSIRLLFLTYLSDTSSNVLVIDFIVLLIKFKGYI